MEFDIGDETPKWIQDARAAIRASSKESSIYVGCDSDRFKKKGLWYIKFATVIIIHKESKHGAVIHHNVEVVRDYSNSLRMKLMQEVQYAIDATFAIIDDIGDRHLEIHLDLNASPKHKSNEAVKEALGYVKGMFGIDAKIKPFAPAASYAGDYFCRGKHLN